MGILLLINEEYCNWGREPDSVRGMVTRCGRWGGGKASWRGGNKEVVEVLKDLHDD